MTLYRITRALRQASRYGGWNRAEQIREALEELDAPWVEVDFFDRRFGQRGANLRAGLGLWPRLPGPLRTGGLRARYRTLWTLGQMFRLLQSAQAQKGGPGVLIWENTDDPLVAVAARATGARLVALPHNINTLYHRRPEMPLEQWTIALAAELAGLAQAHGVVAIAAEEHNFFRLADLPASLLPYFPPSEHRRELATQRESRSERPETVLVLGSAQNEQTATGMRTQLQWALGWSEASRRRVVVAGVETERLASAFPGAGFTFAGRLSDEALRQQMQLAAVLWVHQEHGTGVLTRIPDALCAGVPVVANRLAARGWIGVPGVHVVDYPEQLEAALEGPGAATEPPFPALATKAFQDLVRAQLRAATTVQAGASGAPK